MSISKTFRLESKIQLKATRKMIWKKLLANNSLDLDFHPWWPEQEKTLERLLWSEADGDYENRKIKLKEDLNGLTPKELKIYFEEIKEDEQKIDDYLL